ncbi:hypothetical protein F5X68DRAFT_226545 [Plectosphaerella plurivora]|uniref:Uncharacterized protein n=1 Tax=Plectosphaerella plurivora TaxID=936078 RepID=A0A9P9AGD8_9PEZI|nr:hypothetical protein F5X68DRAFT_226545 [Plectosphaerella plurivora]
MLSTKYHLAYWAVALSSAAIYRLSSSSLVRSLRNESLSSHWQHTPPMPPRIAHLLVALGSVVEYYQIPDDLPKPTVLIHVLLAFMVAGNLECLRQNRKDIEPTVFSLCLRGPRTKLHGFDRLLKNMAECLFLVIPLSAIILFLVLKITDEALSRIWDMSLLHIVPFWPFPDTGLHAKGRRGSAMVSMIIASPFTDVAETLYYVIARKIVPGRPGWVPEPQALIEYHTLHPLRALEMSTGLFTWPIRVWFQKDN